MDRSGSKKAKWNEMGELQVRKTEGVPYKKKKVLWWCHGIVMVSQCDCTLILYIKSSHIYIYLYSALYHTDCFKAASD